MGFPVYDYRKDIRNVLTTPEIRARFFRIDPGQTASDHSHDLGHEVFLLLQGRALFEIEGQRQELGPGQMCVALAHQRHRITALDEEPVVMYLSVTPHILPTHTFWDQEGQRLPHRYMPPEAYDVQDDLSVPLSTLVDQQVAAARGVADAALGCVAIQEAMGSRMREAAARGDQKAVAEARDAMWEALYQLFQRTYQLAGAWNRTAGRLAAAGQG